jgi:hypothetical protein
MRLIARLGWTLAAVSVAGATFLASEFDVAIGVGAGVAGVAAAAVLVALGTLGVIMGDVLRALTRDEAAVLEKRPPPREGVEIEPGVVVREGFYWVGGERYRSLEDARKRVATDRS